MHTCMFSEQKQIKSIGFLWKLKQNRGNNVIFNEENRFVYSPGNQKLIKIYHHT